MTSLVFNLAKLKENADPLVLEREGMLQIAGRQQHRVCVCECVCRAAVDDIGVCGHQRVYSPAAILKCGHG